MGSQEGHHREAMHVPPRTMMVMSVVIDVGSVQEECPDL